VFDSAAGIQKVVEESPSLAVTPPLRERMAAAAAAVAGSVGYTNAGTIEFLLDEDGSFYFLEMNTRLQVEHPVTEMVTDVDLGAVADPHRARRAARHRSGARADAARPRRSNAASTRGPRPGLHARRRALIRGLRAAAGPGVRDDGGVAAGYTVPVYYDSMIAKLIAWGGSRGEAIARMSRALREYHVLGIRTTIPFFLWLMQQPEYREGRYDTTYLDRLLVERRGESFSTFTAEESEGIAIAAALDAYLRASAGRDGQPGAARSGWTQLARREGLRP
jgi:acetyl/propionyl-CoA carboxylase alpha subunit